VHGVPAAIGVTVASLFPLMNPVGALPAFVALTAGEDKVDRKRQAIKAALYAGAILVVFAIAGRAVLHAFGISLPALQIAGGLVVGHAAYGMVVNGPRLSDHERDASATMADVSLTPLAIPLLAGPGAIGVVIGLSARASGATATLGIVLGCVAMTLLVGIVLRLGEPIADRLGANGIGALTRIFGLLILAIAIELFVHGLARALPGLTH
jgi:multiple antibiotic resistance protein